MLLIATMLFFSLWEYGVLHWVWMSQLRFLNRATIFNSGNPIFITPLGILHHSSLLLSVAVSEIISEWLKGLLWCWRLSESKHSLDGYETAYNLQRALPRGPVRRQAARQVIDALNVLDILGFSTGAGFLVVSEEILFPKLDYTIFSSLFEWPFSFYRMGSMLTTHHKWTEGSEILATG